MPPTAPRVGLKGQSQWEAGAKRLDSQSRKLGQGPGSPRLAWPGWTGSGMKQGDGVLAGQ